MIVWYPPSSDSVYYSRSRTPYVQHIIVSRVLCGSYKARFGIQVTTELPSLGHVNVTSEWYRCTCLQVYSGFPVRKKIIFVLTIITRLCFHVPPCIRRIISLPLTSKWIMSLGDVTCLVYELLLAYRSK